MKWIDIPPVWLGVFTLLAWLSRGVAPFDAATLGIAGAVLVTVGLLLMLLAILQMQRKRTTPIPHMQPTALVDSGVFAFSRNPIYLGDALVLAGLALRWGNPMALLLVPVFMWVIQFRFIHAEEARLRAAFGTEFDTYCLRIRRWI